jgi:hypothetical protein
MSPGVYSVIGDPPAEPGWPGETDREAINRRPAIDPRFQLKKAFDRKTLKRLFVMADAFIRGKSQGAGPSFRRSNAVSITITGAWFLIARTLTGE